MMTQLIPYLVLVWVHFIADFVMQSDWMAKNKSKSPDALILHVLVYTGTIMIATLTLPIPAANCFLFLLANFGAHYFTDLVSSQLTSHLRKIELSKPAEEQSWHWFFVVIGADQALHMTALFITYAKATQLP